VIFFCTGDSGALRHRCSSVTNLTIATQLIRSDILIRARNQKPALTCILFLEAVTDLMSTPTVSLTSRFDYSRLSAAHAALLEPLTKPRIAYTVSRDRGDVDIKHVTACSHMNSAESQSSMDLQGAITAVWF